jgi:hypothetical protein
MNSIKDFAGEARALAKNPLGIIALFIILVYGVASFVFTTGETSLKSIYERLPFILFLTLFPVAVLFVFAWLVANHHKKLYGPGDYEKDESFLSTFGPGVMPPTEIREQKTLMATSAGETVQRFTEADVPLDREYGEHVKTGFCLLHAVEVLQVRSMTKAGRYRIRVWIESIQHRSLSDIESVTYRLWDDFTPRMFTSTSSMKNFDLWLHVYGEFPVLAMLKFKDGSTTILQRYLDIPGRPQD